MTYFTLKSYDETAKEGSVQAIVFAWFIFGSLASFALGVLILSTLYFLFQALYDKVYAEAVARVEERLQSEHITVSVNNE